MMKRYPVLDGDSGAVESYGRESTETGAKRVAGRYFADAVKSAYFTQDNVTLMDGSVIKGGAWIACTGE